MFVHTTSLFFSISLAFVVATAACAFGIHFAPKLGLFAMPSARRRHAKPIPVSGGLWIFAGFLSGLAALIFTAENWPGDGMTGLTRMLGCVAAMMVLGYLDDRKVLNVRTKFGVQIMICLAVLSVPQIQELCEAYRPLFGWSIYPITLVFIAGITNAINFIDGADGLLASTLMIFFASLIARAHGFGQSAGLIPVVALLMIPALFAFTIFNWRPAKLFMGDTGSLPFGLLLVVCALSLPAQAHWQGNANEALSGALQFGYPILDLIWVITKRLRRGFSPFRADQNHLHHCLMRLGFSVPACVFTLGLLNVCFQLVSYRAMTQPLANLAPELILVGALSMMLVMWIFTVDRWKNRQLATAITTASAPSLSIVPNHEFTLLIHAHPLFEGQRFDSTSQAMGAIQTLGFLLESNCPKGSQVFWQQRQKILCLVFPAHSVTAADVMGLHARIQKMIDGWIEMFNVSLSAPSLRVSAGASDSLSLADPEMRPLKDANVA